MGYQPFLVSNFPTGIDQSRRPWIIPQDAFPEIFDGYVYRGELSKREGYQGFAQGDLSTYCESRMVYRTTGEATGQVNNGAVLANFSLANTPVRRGTVTITDGVESHTDDGVGGFPTAAAGSINYTTGLISGFQFNAASAAAVTATYDTHQGYPVMGIMSFYTATNTRQCLVVDTTYINRYNPLTDRLDDITVTPYTGSNTNFWSWINYPDPDDSNRLLFVNNQNKVQNYNGTTVADYEVYVERTSYTAENKGNGNGGTNYAFVATNPPIVRRTLYVYDSVGGQTLRDDGQGLLSGDGTGTVDYTTGSITVSFTVGVAVGDPITIDYVGLSSPIDTSLQIFQYQDRLVILRPTYSGGNVHPRRILISGTGIYGDTFVVDAPGAGFIDLPANTWIMGGTFNRADLMIFTQNSVYLLKYTNNDTVPFILEKIEESRGSYAPFSVISYLNRTQAASPRGLIMSDGYRVERMDDKIPRFVNYDVDNANFELLFSAFVDEDRDVYTLYPTPGQTTATTYSTEILVINYEEDTYTKYRIPLSCMGNFEEVFEITWAQLSIYDSWDAMAIDFPTWNNFSWGEGVPLSLGGGHNGQLWKMNLSGVEDNPVKIRNITFPDATTIRITTDFNNYTDGTTPEPYNYRGVADTVFFTAINGTTELNSTQHVITAIDTDYYTFDITVEDTTAYSAYVDGGIVARVIPFEANTKQINPFLEQDKKIQMGYCYWYIQSDNTTLLDADGNSVPAILNVGVVGNDRNIVAIPRNLSVQMNNNPDLIDNYRWAKMWINMTGRFIQMRLSNQQAGTVVKVQAFMFGGKPVGRIV